MRDYDTRYSLSLFAVTLLPGYQQRRFLLTHLLNVYRMQCCGSGMFIPDPDFIHSGYQIRNSGSQIQKQQKRGMEKICCFTFFFGHKFHKIEIILHVFLKCRRKKFGPKIIELLPRKLSLSSQKMGLGSGIRDPGSQTHFGSQILGSKRHRILDPRSGSATLIALK
jgi:hypothetical protein